ncbi:RNA polymerase factor sigma-54 [Paralcaligenes ureilyticus]|uniref:RNA polymerase sigma-54 factor n=1 Tax=Paralcaligenes ureilyticus TaxID=627131 RepID=A0A4R3M998_9BURK|nr:RNA polymerase factor sigma-54 [Paralcaligenes ureilyticus]TCT10161.1 RNA polymerase RpoN-/SigL-like sigma 54 subunit [Paralcaligenes ureilyticus]
MVQLTYQIQARQQTSLTPRLQQSVKLLQMSTLDFNHEVAQAIASNPFLEDPADNSTTSDTPWADPAADPPPETNLPGQRHQENGETDRPENQKPDNGSATVERVEDTLSDAPATYSGDYPRAYNHDRTDNDVGLWAQSQINLQDILRASLCGYKLNARERCLTEFIIEALDPDGYLRTAFSDLADAKQFRPAVSASEWITALKLVQQLGAPGLGARDLSECLALQLSALPDGTAGLELARRIVARALDQLGRCDYSGLTRLMACTEQQTKQACALIRRLNPRPAACFTPIDPSCYVVADAVVRRVGKLWVTMANQDTAPQVRLNNTYAKLFRESRGGDRSPMTHALQEARWLVRSLEQRNTTIQRVAQAIVARQQTFFDYGAVALRPMMLSEIADELGLHESTISRATSHKYLASPGGIFEFKYFFSRELATRSGGTCSAMAVRALIREMIEEENPEEPLSDVALAGKLAHDGIVVARRTVSKYRAQIKCPAAELRRAM